MRTTATTVRAERRRAITLPQIVHQRRAAALLLALGPHVGGEDLLAQPERRRGHFNEFIVVDELDRLLEAHPPRWNEPDGLIGGRGAHVRLLLFLRDVDVHVARPRVLANDHALVYVDRRVDEHLPALLEVGN